MIPAVLLIAALFAEDEDRKVGVDDKPSFHATVVRTDTRIRFLSEVGTTVFDITSATGIDKATIKRKEKEWPKVVLVRLHLGGLESFKVGGKEVAIEWSVSSTGKNEATTSLVSGKRRVAVTKDSPYYGVVRIVGDERKIPLKDGYFEVPLPAKLFEGNPQEITLEWIDFYRS